MISGEASVLGAIRGCLVGSGATEGGRGDGRGGGGDGGGHGNSGGGGGAVGDAKSFVCQQPNTSTQRTPRRRLCQTVIPRLRLQGKNTQKTDATAQNAKKDYKKQQR